MKISRRQVLKGIGGFTMSLPLLESVLPREAWGQATMRHRFAAFIRAGNGIVQAGGDGGERFWPRALGPITTTILKDQNGDRATSELSAYASRLTLLKNVRLPFARNSCGHAEAIPQMLTARNHTGGSSNDPKALGISIDWRIAQALNPAGLGPLTFMAGPQATYIGEGLSWSASGVRTPAERSPANAFMRLTGLATAPAEVQALIAKRRKSVNDLVRTELKALQQNPAMSIADKTRLTQHLDSVRDLEVQMRCDLAVDQAAAINSLSGPQNNDVRVDVVKQFANLAAWAFNCRLNHVVTLQVGEGNDQTQYTIGGTKLPRFHWISHRINSDGADGTPIANAVDLHAQIDRLQLQLFKHLLDRLDSYGSPYGGTLLDDTAAVWMNDLGSGPPHSADNTPWVIAGSAGGALKTGVHLDHAGKNNNLVLNTLLSAVGVRKTDGSPTDDFGDPGLSKGVINAMLA